MRRKNAGTKYWEKQYLFSSINNVFSRSEENIAKLNLKSQYQEDIKVGK